MTRQRLLTRNTQKLKQVVQEHVDADSITQSGFYWSKHISECIFEQLPEEEAKEFFASFPDAVGVDSKDLSLVHWKFH